MKLLQRNTSILTGKSNLGHLYSIKDFPVFMGCVESPAEDDIVADMNWDICRDTGIIQLRDLVPLDVLYLNQHNDGTGSIWKEHYAEFARFVKRHNSGKYILEIGGGHGLIAGNFLSMEPSVEWTIVEPNPQNINDSRVRVVQGWFDEKFAFEQEVDTIVHSHVLEHVYEPKKFIKHIGDFLNVGDNHIFTFPNMWEQLSRKYTNCLSFEHTVFLAEYFVDHLLFQSGFEIVEKEYFKDHSIFYATRKVSDLMDGVTTENKYDEYKKLFMDFVNYHTAMVDDLNNKITNSPQPVYLFGAHIFSQYLIGFGLETGKITAILDNSLAKQGKRLYGTILLVSSPKALSGKGRVNIILKAGIYNEEIKKDILENINNEVVFW